MVTMGLVEMTTHFERKTIADYPVNTHVEINIAPADWEKKFISDEMPVESSVMVTIPTKEIFQQGDWLSRRFSGIKFPLIKKWINNNMAIAGYYSFSIINQ